ncbi:hypothetical protein DPMN_130641 [Dreissena polymorpha]|uniref:Uncharacterized protein n=1 Tax=Dreissena polymorpha TaxID=45954 RepID=A0A9D4H716_DREPO|nr:hypothetical protein DPMN_130641 [Dreissena polymorpha]
MISSITIVKIRKAAAEADAGRHRVGNALMHNVLYQFEVHQCRNKEVNFQDSMARTDEQTAEITTLSTRFSKSAGIIQPNPMALLISFRHVLIYVDMSFRNVIDEKIMHLHKYPSGQMAVDL